MNKADLINVVVEKTGMTKKDTEKAINETLQAITEALASGDKVQLFGFGNFEVRDTKERNGVNPKLLKELKEQGVDEATAKAQASVFIPASKKPAFKAAKALKDAVKE
ncbi:HU family DNA-binding protein [Paenibacillus sp. 1781tsa1]|uniref:HU family DNA-binding protein n=1 Tax=Paenibacillus sp. 1781tsa1 TaxID=2953810 RepID=UPI0020A09C4A|nr:HU family DNA-binding protein [Paenibacillus sp. 1781tsa1]MCP1185075.1 HU family DNA-binding protein [Paenibacillus sp. 1781tsa1]